MTPHMTQTPAAYADPIYFNVALQPRTLQATEQSLTQAYQAARSGLKGDTLALAAGMQPVEFRRLQEMDPRLDAAVAQGRADGERALSDALHKAAFEGDAKAALDLLKHVYKWTAPQQLQVQVEGRISITAALEEAENRVLVGAYMDVTPVYPAGAINRPTQPPAPDPRKLTTYDTNSGGPEPYADADLQPGARAGADGAALVPSHQKRPARVRDVRIPVGEEGDPVGELLWTEALAARGAEGPR